MQSSVRCKSANKIRAFNARSLNTDRHWCLRYDLPMIMANNTIANDLDQELFSELTEPLVQPLLLHMVAPLGPFNKLRTADQWETFVGMEEFGGEFMKLCDITKQTFVPSDIQWKNQPSIKSPT